MSEFVDLPKRVPTPEEISQKVGRLAMDDDKDSRNLRYLEDRRGKVRAIKVNLLMQQKALANKLS